MELTDDDRFESSSCIDDRKVEPEELLEEYWFFGNLPDRKTRLSRCFSDRCPSSNFSQEMLVRKTHGQNSSSLKKHSKGIDIVCPTLIRTPTMPPSVTREQIIAQETESNSRASSMPQSSRNDLLRAACFPPWIGREEVQDEESDFAMGKLIRQASLSLPDSDVLPPPSPHASKGITGRTQSFSILRHHPEKKPELESINMEGCKEMRKRYMMNQMKIRKSLNDLETEEVQGFRDLGFRFEKKDLNPSVVNILPGLQEKNRVDLGGNKVTRRPYLSEAWLLRSSAPQVPNWADKRSAEDMKTQIKFWARTVASNVRQEC